MFTHLKIRPLKGLKEYVLLDLGKINVICGKNNSGKSTLLEGAHEHRVIGKRFEEKDIDEFYRMTVNHLGFGGEQTQWSSVYSSLLKRILPSEKVWFGEAGDKVTFINSLQAAYNKVIAPSSFNSNVIDNIYDQWLMGEDVSILLPPKRQLQLATNINSGEMPAPSGSGVLNYLFYTPSQIASSDERKVYDRIRQAFTAISGGYQFEIFLDRGNLLTLCFAYNNQAWIDAQDCGLGLQDLLIILCFALYPEYGVVLIEEPESHLHPDMQRKLLAFLREETTKQFFMTTHSNVFLNNALVDRVFFTRFEDFVIVDDATSRASMLNDLGYAVTDNLVSDLIILVEGPSDTPVIEEFLVKLGLFGPYDIKIWPLGGDIMDQVDLSVFAQNYAIIALVDNDPGSRAIREKFMRNCERYSIPVYRLQRYSIENYFSIKALREVFKGQIPPALTTLEPEKKLEEQIGINVKKCNRKIASRMDLSEIGNTDLYEFFEHVKALCRSKS